MALNVTYKYSCRVVHSHTHVHSYMHSLPDSTLGKYYPCLHNCSSNIPNPFNSFFCCPHLLSLLSLYPPFPSLFALHLSHSLLLSLFPFFICSFSFLTPFLLPPPPSYSLFSSPFPFHFPYFSLSPSPLLSYLHLPVVVALQPPLVGAETEQAADWLAG